MSEPEPDEPNPVDRGGERSDPAAERGAGERVSIVLNGEERTVPADLTAAGLLRELDVDPRGVVVEVNRDIVRREALDETTVNAGDRVEIVRFVGGG